MEQHDATDSQVEISSGNVFADLNLPCSEADMLKVRIARAITATLSKRGLTQKQAGEIVGLDQARISDILRGRLKGISIERLLETLAKLGRDVEIQISRQKDRPGKLTVRAA